MRVPRITGQGNIPIATVSQPERTVAAGRSVAGVFDQAGRLATGIAVNESRKRAAEDKLAAEFNARREAQRGREEQGNAYAEFSRGIDDLSDELTRGDDVSGISESFAERSEEMRRDAMEGMESDAARAAFGLESERLLTAHFADVKDKQFKREQEAGRIDLNDNLETAANSIVMSPNEAVRDALAEQAIESIQSSELLLDEDKQPAIDKFLNSIDVRTITSLIDLADATDDEAEALGHLAAAEAVLKDPANTPHLTSEQRTDLRRNVKSEKNDAIYRFNKGEIRDLGNRILNVSGPEEGEALTAEITAMLDEGIIGDERALSMDAQLQRQVAVLDKADSGATYVEMARRMGVPIDPKNVGAVNAYVDETFMPSIEGMTYEEQVAEKVSLVADIDIMPESFAAEFRSVSRSDNADLAAIKAREFMAFKDASPQAMSAFDAETTIFYENMSAAADMNVPSDEALKRERDIARMGTAEREDVQKRYDETQRVQLDVDWFNGHAQADLDKSVPEWWKPDPGGANTDPGIAQMFARESKNMYFLDPVSGVDKARTRAMERVAMVAGYTEVGGHHRNMYMAPELKYPKLKGDSEEITRQLVVDVMGADIPELEGLDAEALSGRLKLTADEVSVGEHVNGVPTPGYRVWLMADENSSGPLLLIDTAVGEPLRFYPDDTVFEEENLSALRAEVAKESSMSLGAARELVRKAEENGDQFIETFPGEFEPADSIGREVVEP